MRDYSRPVKADAYSEEMVLLTCASAFSLGTVASVLMHKQDVESARNYLDILEQFRKEKPAKLVSQLEDMCQLREVNELACRLTKE